MSGLKPQVSLELQILSCLKWAPQEYLCFNPCTKSYAYIESLFEDSHYRKWRVSDVEEAINKGQQAQQTVIIGDTVAEMILYI